MAIQLLWSPAMMGQLPGIQPKIFYHHMNLEQRDPRRKTSGSQRAVAQIMLATIEKRVLEVRRPKRGRPKK
jgi:hypothetical protein